MSGAEIGAVIGLISGIISIIDATKKVYDAAKDKHGLHTAFRDVASKLPLVHDTLKSANTSLRRSDLETTPESFKTISESCKFKADQLHGVFQKVMPQEGESRLERYYKAVRAIGKGGRVETLMKGILEDLQLLSVNRVVKLATEQQVKELKEAIEAVSALEPSVPDEEFRETGPTFNNYGPGLMKNFVNQGDGNVFQSDGDQYFGEAFVKSKK